MSDDRLDELGLPRREFLKRLAVGVFVVPSVVSFVLDAVAEGATQSLPNQCFPNQGGVLAQLSSALYYVGYYRNARVISRTEEGVLHSQLVQAQTSVQNHAYLQAYKQLGLIQSEILNSGRSGTVPALLSAVQHAITNLNCN